MCILSCDVAVGIGIGAMVIGGFGTMVALSPELGPCWTPGIVFMSLAGFGVLLLVLAGIATIVGSCVEYRKMVKDDHRTVARLDVDDVLTMIGVLSEKAEKLSAKVKALSAYLGTPSVMDHYVDTVSGTRSTVHSHLRNILKRLSELEKKKAKKK